MTADPTGPLVERINAICHDEQMTVWEDEVLDEFREFLREPQDYEDTLAMHRAANAAIRHIAEGVLAADLLRRAGISEPAGLVWQRIDAGVVSIARTPFLGRYETYEDREHGWFAFLVGNSQSERVGDPECYFSNESAARAACEADYAARALSMWPGVAAEVERLRGWKEAGERAVEIAQMSEDMETAICGLRGLQCGNPPFTGKRRRSLDEVLATPPAPVVTSPQEPADDECEAPCPVCGCEERGQGGYLSCECPAPASPSDLCSDCPPPGYPTDATRCEPCPCRGTVSAEAVREVLDFCDTSATAAREEAAEGERGDPYNEVLEAEAAVYAIVSGRLIALLPAPAPQEEIAF